MSRLWTPHGNGRKPVVEDVPPQHMATVACAKCGNEMLTLNGHGWAICWREDYPKRSCGWFLRIYPGPFDSLQSDPVAFVNPRPDGSCQADLVYDCIRRVRDYWVRNGIAQVVQEDGRTGIKMTGKKHWDWFYVEEERRLRETAGLPPEDVQ